ncbi:hypothetical protein HII36_31325 [Nonomuraea sp. NN258]|uniref:hypothetical protein n=1 Tax=Nonomuraea antri TaxID=2730852 RepID=UPI001568FD57|nr:hypothetical protein [Nonomuraea antri]NRQ36292.1 hypothetical protein [Nonomuraea antri]
MNTGTGAVAQNHAYPLRTPVLAMRFGSVQVQLATARSDRVTAAEVEFARELAKEALAFAQGVERMFRGRPHKKGAAA